MSSMILFGFNLLQSIYRSLYHKMHDDIHPNIDITSEEKMYLIDLIKVVGKILSFVNNLNNVVSLFCFV